MSDAAADVDGQVDCVVIGAGPAGMTAALYLARFHRTLQVLDAGSSRARWIPTSHNCPGFPGGISGDDLLARLRLQAIDYGVNVVPSRATQIERANGGLVVSDEAGTRWLARTVLLATGVRDVLPEEPWVDAAVACGAMRLCAICDGYEAADSSIAVYGPLEDALRHAQFLRTFSRSVSVVPSDPATPNATQSATASAADIAVLPRATRMLFDGSACAFEDATGQQHPFDTVYPVLGSLSQSGLARDLGARVDDNGELVVSRDQSTSVEGLYAVGDVVSALNQISVALGHAAVAATSIHNALPRNYR